MHAFPFDFHSGDQVLHGLFLDRPDHVSYGNLADELYNQYRSDLTVASVVVIRPPVDQPFDSHTFPMDQLKPVFERLPHVPVHLLGSRNFEHFITPNLNVRIQGMLEGGAVTSLLNELRQFELRRYAIDANALLRTTGARVFRAPSGKYCRSFIRVGNVQIHRAALDGFFFWLLPWLRDCHAIVTETWTISSIALNTGRLLGRYAPTTHHRCEIDMLSEYHDGSSELVPGTTAVLRRVAASGSGRILILISSTMSGTLVGRLQETIDRVGLTPSRFQFGALYKLGQTQSLEALCDISDGIAGGTFECFDAPPSDAGSTPEIIDIDKRTYFPLRIKESPVLVRKSTAELAYDFFADYRDSGLISVHRDSFLLNGQRFRHHAIFTDVLKVLDQPPFNHKFDQRLTAFDCCPFLILTRPHPAGIALAQRAQSTLTSRFNRLVPVFQHLDLNFAGHSEPSDKELLAQLKHVKEQDSILVIDDASVTGRRLSRYQLSLREIGFLGRIHYFVGVARPERRADWDLRVRRLRLRQPKTLPQHTVDYVEFVVLPDWDESRCPWCRERDIYRRLSTKHRPLAAILAERAHRLQRAQSTEPMQDDIFFKLSTEGKMRLTPNSIFLPQPASEAEVFAAVASALQEMRTNPKSPDYLGLAYPEVPVVSLENYLGGHFNDSVIRASILRAATRSELERPHAHGEGERHDRMAEIVTSSASDINNLTLELLLGVALHKLPALSLGSEQRAALQKRGYGETIQLLLSAAEENL